MAASEYTRAPAFSSQGNSAEVWIFPVRDPYAGLEEVLMQSPIKALFTSFLVLNRPRLWTHSNNLRVMPSKQYHQSKSSKRQKTASKFAKEGSNEEVLLIDVKNLLKKVQITGKSKDDGVDLQNEAPSTPNYVPPERFSEVEVEISELSSTGDGLGVASSSDHVYVVPFTVPGDVVVAKVVNHFSKEQYTLTDFVKITKSATQRDGSLIKCQYFTKCAGCQIQMLPYELQLNHKKTIVEKAFRNFSSLTPEAIPAVGDTVGSPMQYGYRTKLTPHFDGPPGSMSRRAKRDPSERKGFVDVPPIGFMLKGTRRTLDIEDCPIGTDAVREGIKIERKKIAKEIAQYKKGATILLRETTTRKPLSGTKQGQARCDVAKNGDSQNGRSDQSPSTLRPSNDSKARLERPDVNASQYIEEKTYITDQRAMSTEYIHDFEFKNTAGAFFQNNNSVLPTFTAYIRDRILPSSDDNQTNTIKYLIDAYCGSGLFTITLSSLFSSSTGIDIAGVSIVSARENADANKISNASFMTADASKLFQEVTYPPERTAVVIDPPRKGCDDAFLQQLLKFGPRRVVYVSCNVHTQARDIGVLVEGQAECRYEIESLQGFDFFPQTGHVEGVAVLARST